MISGREQQLLDSLHRSRKPLAPALVERREHRQRERVGQPVQLGALGALGQAGAPTRRRLRPHPTSPCASSERSNRLA